MIPLALARRIRLYGPHDHEHEWSDADTQSAIENEENLEEGDREDEMKMPKAPFDGVCNPDSIDLPEDWNSPVAPGATQNKLSYCIVYFLDKSDNKVSNEFMRKRLRRESIVFGADLPQDGRAIAKVASWLNKNARCGKAQVL
jgi:hypothetical protein